MDERSMRKSSRKVLVSHQTTTTENVSYTRERLLGGSARRRGIWAKGETGRLKDPQTQLSRRHVGSPSVTIVNYVHSGAGLEAENLAGEMVGHMTAPE